MMKLVTKSPTYREGENQEKRLAWDLGSGDVGADSDKGRVDKSSVCGSDGVGSGDSVGKGGAIGEDLGISVSITLAVVVGSVGVSVDSSVVWESNSLGDGIESLSDGIKTSAGSEGDSSDNHLRVSISVTLAVVSGGAGDGDVGGVHAGSGLEADDGVGGVSIWVSGVTQVLSRDSSQQRGSKGLKM